MLFAKTSKAALSNQLERVIYVEGQDDAWLINEILADIGADSAKIGIVYIDGNGGIDRELKFLAKSAAYTLRKTTHIAFILDADTSASQTLAKLNLSLSKFNIPNVGHAQTITYDDGRCAAAFLFPDGQSAGELEDLAVSAVRTDDRLKSVEDALESVEANHGVLNKRSKRLIRMYISVLPIKPGGVGRAFCEGVFPKSHDSFQAVIEFVRTFAEM